MDYLTALIELAEKYDFKIFADECYSEIYRYAPPPGLMQVSEKLGADPNRVVTFHSLSKRSNLPGLRSGFAASGEKNIKQMKQLKLILVHLFPSPCSTFLHQFGVMKNMLLKIVKFMRKNIRLPIKFLMILMDTLAQKQGFFFG